jgi:hypothetical protein
MSVDRVPPNPYLCWWDPIDGEAPHATHPPRGDSCLTLFASVSKKKEYETTMMQVEKSSEGKEEASGNQYVVVTTTFPTWDRGRSWSRAEMIAHSEVGISKKKFETYDKAVKYAKKRRDNSEWFDGYDDDEEDDDDDDLPPWNSADLENYDNDEEVLIRVMKHSAIAKEIAEDKEFLKQARIQAQFAILVAP